MSNKTLALIVGTMIGGTFLSLGLWMSSRSSTAQPAPVPQAAVTPAAEAAPKSDPEPTQDPAVEETTADLVTVEVAPAPQYRIVSDVTTHDDWQRAQIEMEVFIEEHVTEFSLRRLLDHVYAEVMRRGPFKSFEHPNYFFVYVYARKGQDWITMADKVPDREFRVILRDELLATVNAPPVSKHGFSEVERQMIFRDYVRAEDQGNLKAEQTFPDLAPGSLSEANSDEYYDIRYNLASALKTAYKDELAKEVGLTDEVLREIAVEGMRNHWKTPRIPVEWR